MRWPNARYCTYILSETSIQRRQDGKAAWGGRNSRAKSSRVEQKAVKEKLERVGWCACKPAWLLAYRENRRMSMDGEGLEPTLPSPSGGAAGLCLRAFYLQFSILTYRDQQG
jgi:hypothetical protein